MIVVAIIERPAYAWRSAITAWLPVAARAQPAPVIGGNDAPAGKWPDVAAMYYPDGQQGCTGTLIAPTVVLTAGHCIYDGGPSAVLVGTNSLARRGDGDFLPVTKRVEYPSSQSSYDVAVVVLGSGLLLRSSGTVFLAVFVAMLAAMGFVLAPVVAMAEGARRGRPAAGARRR